jgi:hypothetical protein
MNNEQTLQLVYQYLSDQSYYNSLTALQEETGIKYESHLFEKPHQLRSILDEHQSLKLALSPLDIELANEMSAEQELVSYFLISSHAGLI